MSLLRNLLTHLLSIVFISSTIFAITSYTSVTLFQQENLKTFIKTEIAPSLVSSRCAELCSDPSVPESSRNVCIDGCEQQASGNLDMLVDESINNIYNYQLFGFITLNDIVNILSSFTLFVFITAFSGVDLFVVSERPYKTMGWNLLYIGGSLIFTSFLPQLLSSYFSTESGSIINKLISYSLGGPYLNYGIIFLTIGAVFLLLGKQKKKKK